MALKPFLEIPLGKMFDRHGLRDPMTMTRDRFARVIIKEILEGRDVEGGLGLCSLPNMTFKILLLTFGGSS